ncbi:hypothetical protein BgAZ_203540 [Babesia gibsoni]|uniref:Uncharacterized protein n=1 Tax=Babesia gibsoni TaxID=33632 RepID=A0AAD8PDJ0_BABGI|nr:hypothetical protein BgAZ_203540 [Babesia gibsoni]
MEKNSHTAAKDSLFSIDIEGEGFVPEPEEDYTECSINVKEKSSNKEKVAEKVETIEIQSATRICPFKTIRKVLSKEQEELYRTTLLDLRRFLYNSIVCEDFCVAFEVSKAKADHTNHVSDISDIESEVSPSDAVASQDTEKVVPPSPSAFTVDEGIYGSRKAPRLDSVTNVSNNDSSHSAKGDYTVSTGRNQQHEAVVDKNSATAVLSGIRTKAVANNSGDEGTTIDAAWDDCIKLTVNVKKLTNTLTDIEHVQMCSSVPFPRLFRIPRENISSGLITAGKRYFLASDSESKLVHSICHKTFLAHLYRRKRSVCFFCGRIKCPRSINSKQSCENMRCHRCSFIHKWGKNKCQDPGTMLQYYLCSNDWRNERRNHWINIPERLRGYIKCFYCGKSGDASFHCRKIACPRAAETLKYRCLELLGRPKLDQLVRQKPEMFRHLRDPDFVFK